MGERHINDNPERIRSRTREGVERVFLGENGLRAGWRLLLYAISVVLLGWLLSAAVRPLFSHHANAASPTRMIVGELIALFSAIIPAVIASRLEERPWEQYGLPLRRFPARKFAAGLLVGFSALSLLLLLIFFFHGFSLGRIELSSGELARYAVLWGIGFLLVGFFEEFLFRGYSQFTLATGIGFWPAAILLSAGFGAIHLRNLGEDWMGALAAALIALVFVFSLWRTGSLWFAVGAHAGWDWAESYFYGVPDSGFKSPGTLFNPSFHGSKWITGGSVGPEGSALVFVAIAFIAVIIHVLYPRRQWKIEDAAEPQVLRPVA